MYTQKLKHEFSGSWRPDKFGVARHGARTFSVGIYQPVPKASGIGTKKTAVKVRVSGSVHDHELVYEKAREICLLLDEGKYTGPKNVKVKR